MSRWAVHNRWLASAAVLAALGSAVLLAGCQGDTARLPPVHLVQNMDQQKRFDPQEPNEFFDDGRAMRLPVEGTVARGELADDDHRYRGRIGTEYANTIPIKVTVDLIEHGRSRYNIYCAPCHDHAGTGQGVVAKRGLKHGMVPVPNLHDRRLRAMRVGQIFATISDGARGMPAYGAQIPVDDRWAVVAYVRAIQIARSASARQLPGEMIDQLGNKKDQAKPDAKKDQADPKKDQAAPDTMKDQAAPDTMKDQAAPDAKKDQAAPDAKKDDKAATADGAGNP